MNDFEVILKESYNYKGNWFWENLILSHVIRNLPSEIQAYGNASVIEAYSEIYGEASIPLFEYLVEQDIDVLKEASNIKGTLLFESYGDKNIKEYLVERFPFPNFDDMKQGVPYGFGVMPESPVMKAARGSMASQVAIGGMLSRAWEKLKSIGRAVFAPLIPYLQKGFAWAKGMAQQGLSWFNRTPWAKMILPLLLITGGIAAARKLINKVRRRKMSPEEELALKNYAMKNNSKINEMRKKANLKPIKV